MAETQDLQRLVVSLEARLTNFDRQMAKLRGDTNRTLGQVEARFSQTEARIGRFGEQTAKGLAKFGAFPIREGALVALGYAFVNSVRHMKELEDQAKKTGFVLDDQFIKKADEFERKWNSRIDAWIIKFKEGIGEIAMLIGDLVDSADKLSTDNLAFLAPVMRGLAQGVGPLADIARGLLGIHDALHEQEKLQQVTVETSKANKEAFNPEVINKYKDALKALQQVQDDFIKKQKEMAQAASGLSDEFQTFTDTVIDDYHKIGEAAKALAKDILRNIIHAELFGSGPYAGILGTAGTSGAPGGLIGGLINRVMGGVMAPSAAAGPASVIPDVVTGGGAIISPGSKKFQDQIFGGSGGPVYTPGPIKSTGLNPPSDLILSGSGSDTLRGGIVMPGEPGYDDLLKAYNADEVAGKSQFRILPGQRVHSIKDNELQGPQTSTLPLKGDELAGPQFVAPGKADFGEFAPVKSANRIASGLKQSADVIQQSARTAAPAIAQGIAKIAQTVAGGAGGGWGGAGGFPILNSVFGSFGSIGGAYEHSIPFGGAMAGGGDVNPGSAYLVGENGPEMISPRFPGRVDPMSSSGGLAVHVTPSKYFDVHVEHISNRGNARTLNAARKSFPNTSARLSKLGTV